jgi:ABC-type glycerol-3-phosphate transport system permease component
MTSARRHKAFAYAVTIPFVIVLAFPFFWMAVTSFKPEAQVYDPT